MAHAGIPLSKIELRLSATHLPNLDVLSKSDPQVYVHMKGRNGVWTEVGRTEVINDNLNPNWVTPVVVDYYFEEVQDLRFVVYDVDKDSKDLIGEVIMPVSKIVSAKGRTVMVPIHDSAKPGRNSGSLKVVAEELKNINAAVQFKFRGSHLDKKDFFGKSDPYFIIARMQDQTNFVPVHKSEILKKTLDPIWNDFSIPLQTLNNGDYDRPLLFQVFDWNSNGKDEHIGEARTTLRQLIDTRRFEIKSHKGKTAGQIEAIQVEIVKQHSFLEYLAGGCDVSLIVAIDFTASNGAPTEPLSLHYMTNYQTQPNEYAKAIMAVGDILLPYDSDGMIPVYGFGAKLPPAGEVSHCFPLNGNPSNPEVPGVRGILDAYLQAISNVQLYGPTNFSPVINTSTLIASRHNSQADQKYFILLIITDGEFYCFVSLFDTRKITDMDDTISSIVKGSSLPLSIIIVGVGSADFSNMKVLDGDDAVLRSQGRPAERDIVQFVAFRDYKQRTPADLAADTLVEVPQQFMAWMKARKIVPNPPRPPPQFSQNPMGAPPPMTGAPPPMTGAPPPMTGAPPPMGGVPPHMSGVPPSMGGVPPPMASAPVSLKKF